MHSEITHYSSHVGIYTDFRNALYEIYKGVVIR